MKALRPSASHVRLIGCGPIIGRCGPISVWRDVPVFLI